MNHLATDASPEPNPLTVAIETSDDLLLVHESYQELLSLQNDTTQAELAIENLQLQSDLIISL